VGFVDEVGIKVNGMFGFDSDNGRELADVNRRSLLRSANSQ
jgi:hypothetical protein